MFSERPIFIDIDGTLTNHATEQWAPIYAERLQKIRDLMSAGIQIVIWSGGGTAYAQEFVRRHNLDGVTAIGKPEFTVDDNPTIRPGGLSVKSPSSFFG